MLASSQPPSSDPISSRKKYRILRPGPGRSRTTFRLETLSIRSQATEMSPNTPDSATALITDIDPAGDVILDVGSEECGDQAYLRVSSKVLGLASSAFAAMFSPKWSDSTVKASSSEPQHISLPEDESSPMEWICQILHYRKDISTEKDIPFLVGVAQLCDKYDLESPIKTWAGLCLEKVKVTTPYLHDMKEVDLMGVMYISFVFRNSKIFWLSSAVLLNAKSVPDLVYDRYELGGPAASLLEDEAFEYILEQRQDILNRLRGRIDGMLGPKLINLHESITLVHHLQELTRIGLWPLSTSFHKASTRDVLHKLADYQPCNQSHCGCSRLGIGSTVKTIWLDFSGPCGLCLECYRNGKASPSSGNCTACEPAFCGRPDKEDDRRFLGTQVMWGK